MPLYLYFGSLKQRLPSYGFALMKMHVKEKAEINQCVIKCAAPDRGREARLLISKESAGDGNRRTKYSGLSSLSLEND